MSSTAGSHDGADRRRVVVHIAPMRHRHLRAVLRIEQQSYPKPWSRGLFTSELSMRSARSYLVARVSGAVVGYSGLMFAPTEAHVTTIAVDPTAQRRGIASRLLTAQMRVAVRHGLDDVTLEVRESNVAAQRLYERFGFESVGVRRGYYVDRRADGSTNREDAVVMWLRELSDPARRFGFDRIESELPGEVEYDAPLVASGIDPGPWVRMEGDAGPDGPTPREIDL